MQIFARFGLSKKKTLKQKSQRPFKMVYKAKFLRSKNLASSGTFLQMQCSGACTYNRGSVQRRGAKSEPRGYNVPGCLFQSQLWFCCFIKPRLRHFKRVDNSAQFNWVYSQMWYELDVTFEKKQRASYRFATRGSDESGVTQPRRSYFLP